MKSKKIFKATFLVMVITIASRFLGLIRDSLVAYYFGAGAITDAYKAAVMVPETLFTIIGLGVSTVFIPMLSKIRYRDSKEKMFEFANNVIGLLIIMSLCIFVLGNIFTESIVNIIAPGFSKENMELAISLTRISLINLLFMSVNVCFLSMLQVCEDFVIPSILGMFFNAPIILYLIIFKDVNILGVTIANVIGNILRV
ncbi:lipid II flippase MurJ, partial [Clostridium sp.]